MRVLAVLAAVLALAACAPMGEGPSTPPGIDAAACVANGGQVQPVCRMGRPACIFTYADAGKACTDSEQCKGRCLADGDMPAAGTPAKGVCETNNDLCGCKTEIIDGKATAGRCVD